MQLILLLYVIIHEFIVYWWKEMTALILGSHPASERRRYKVTPSLIGWVQT